MIHSPQPSDQSAEIETSQNVSDLDAPTVLPTSEPVDWETMPVSGQMIDDNELIREIARGGMGVVYLAKHKALNRLVALKMVLSESGNEGESLKRFRNEAQAAAKLDHPGIVPVYDVGTFNGRPYFTMAYVDGKTLSSMISDGPLTAVRSAAIARDVSAAIAHAHQHEIIHRDIKPANIMLDAEGVPHVTDFGVCKSLAAQDSAGSDLTMTGEVIGTPHYMPPEQAGSDGGVICPASDVYSIGAVLYAMLTARPPFQAPTPLEVVTRVLTAVPVPPSQLTADVPTDLETITLKCLSKERSQRYRTATELSEDLTRFLNDEPILAKPPGAIRQIQHYIKRHVMLASVSGSVALLLVFLTCIVFFSLLRANRQIFQLQGLLESERMLATQFAAAAGKGKAPRKAFEIRRLSVTAENVLENHPNAAMHLAIRSIELAIESDVEIPKQSVDLLKAQIVDSGVAEQSDLARLDQMQANEIVKIAKSAVTRELTEYEISIYGLKSPASGEPESVPTPE